MALRRESPSKSLAKQNKKHVGVSNYNQVKKELINKYPSIKKCLTVSKRNMKKFLEINRRYGVLLGSFWLHLNHLEPLENP